MFREMSLQRYRERGFIISQIINHFDSLSPWVAQPSELADESSMISEVETEAIKSKRIKKSKDDDSDLIAYMTQAHERELKARAESEERQQQFILKLLAELKKSA